MTNHQGLDLRRFKTRNKLTKKLRERQKMSILVPRKGMSSLMKILMISKRMTKTKIAAIEML